MSAESIALQDIPSAFEGLTPAIICTVAEDGTPNATFLSVVHRIDETHVALSRQFFKKTDANTAANPYAQVLLIEAETGRMFWLDIVYEHTESEGPRFERMRTNLDAVAAYAGMENVFKLKGTDVCRVAKIELMPGNWPEKTAAPRRDVKMVQVEEASGQLAAAEDMEELLATALRVCQELLECPHVFVMLLDETGERLYTVASAGFPASGAGSEVRLGEGLIGLAAARKQAVRVTHLSRELSYSQASLARTGGRNLERLIQLPHLHEAQAQLLAPMLAHRKLVGMLCLQSETPGAFHAADECVASILASQIATAMATLRSGEPVSPAVAAAPTEPPVEVKHYAEDDSIFFDNAYVIKGVAGGILWRLLREREASGRSEFSNKEIRLDSSLDLPDIKDNLEARLILLRRRLEERCDYLRIERVARGRFSLQAARPLSLVHIEGGGPL